MVEVVVVARNPEGLELLYSLKFDLPQIPAAGDCISINRPDTRKPFGEDLIVRKVWWMLSHAVTAPFADEREEDRSGQVVEIFVECDVAIGPYASESWRRSYEGKPGVEHFQVAPRRVF